MTSNDFDEFEIAFEAAANKNRRTGAGLIAQLITRDADSANELSSLLDSDSTQFGALEASCDHRRLASTASLEFLERRSPAIPGYIVRRHIGAGGQADVFLARQVSTGQDVAIKVFRGSRLAESQHRRIDAETEALVRLQLPNVVAILDRGQTACGREYLVTRLVNGLPIDKAAAQLLTESRQKFAGLFTKVAETLARVHRHGILHRDLKPSNILVDRDGEPYVLDFGLASFFADPSGRLLTVTPNEAFQGSILWASPEQVDASFGAVDQRSDIYSLGVVMYQSLTGRFPYPVDGGFLDVTQHIVRSAPARLTALEFEAIVLRALEKQPESRFQSADEFAAVLRGLPKERADEPSVVPNQPQQSRSSRFAPLGAIAAVCAALWLGLNAAMLDVSDRASLESSNIAAPTAPGEVHVTRLDDKLAAFGVVPPQWTRVGPLETARHEIERANLSIEGDFVLLLQVSAERASRAGFMLTLVNADGGADLTIVGEKANTWSDNESWQFRTPAGMLLEGLPVGTHSFVLQRDGALLTFAVDSIHLPQQNDTLLATFAGNGSHRFNAVRVATTGPTINVQRLRLNEVEPTR